MQRTIFLIAILCSLLNYGQQRQNAVTDSPMLVKGTNIYLVPPTGFMRSDNFKGLQKPNDQSSMIMVTEIPGPYEEIYKSLNAENLKKGGMTLKRKEERKVGSYEGSYFEVDHNINNLIFSKHVLVYGDDKFTVMINGIFPKDSVELGRQIHNSILSITLDSSINVDPRSDLDYSLDESGTNLRFKAVMGNGMLFNRDGKTPTESYDRATVITDRSFAKMTIADKKLFSITRLKKYPEDYSVIVSKGINKIEIGGLTGYELFANNNDKPEQEIYQVILFTEEGQYYVFLASFLAHSKDAIQDVKKLILTFKRKS